MPTRSPRAVAMEDLPDVASETRGHGSPQSLAAPGVATVSFGAAACGDGLEVFVTTLSGARFGPFSLGREAQLADLRVQVKQATGIPAREQQLVWGTMLLQQSGDLDAVRKKHSVSGAVDLQVVRVAGRPVRVALRCRPFNMREITHEAQRAVFTDVSACSVAIQVADGVRTSVALDAVFDGHSTQKEVYDGMMVELVRSAVVDGYGATLLAYGALGAGKTFTVKGYGEESDELVGILPRLFNHLVEEVHAAPGKRFLLMASFSEVCNEEVRDLLDDVDMTGAGLRTGGPPERVRCRIREHPVVGTFVHGQSVHVFEHAQELAELHRHGMERNTYDSMPMGSPPAVSSLVFSIWLWCLAEGCPVESIQLCKLTVVDVVSTNLPERSRAGRKPDHSLACLRSVVRILGADGDVPQHVPYRESKLVHMLRGALGGGEAMAVIVVCSPAEEAVTHTADSLDFAERMRKVINFPKTVHLDREAFESFVLGVSAGGHQDQPCRTRLTEAVRRFLDG